MSGDISGYHNWCRMLLASSGAEARVAPKHPTVHKATPPNTELSGPKCQYCLLLRNPGLDSLATNNRNLILSCFKQKKKKIIIKVGRILSLLKKEKTN